MTVIIKEWPNETATLMTENGQVIWTFSSSKEAHKACTEWHNLVANEPVIIMSEENEEPDSLSSAA